MPDYAGIYRPNDGPKGRSRQDRILELRPSRPSGWSTLLARIYEVCPLICLTCQTPLTFIALPPLTAPLHTTPPAISASLRFLTDPEPITRILAHVGQLPSPPLLHPAREPPQAELDMGRAGGQAEQAALGSFPDDLGQTLQFDPAEPEPLPEDDFDQTWGAWPLSLSRPSRPPSSSSPSVS